MAFPAAGGARRHAGLQPLEAAWVAMSGVRRIFLARGQVFGRLTVIREVAQAQNGDRRYLCRCLCGKLKTTGLRLLRSGCTRSCGCLLLDRPIRIKHGFARKGAIRTEWHIWQQMKHRCENPNCPEYKNYGGRGISVCARWHSFTAFLSDVGCRPAKDLMLDRKNNNGNYEPGNVRWADSKTQNRNRRDNRLVVLRGERIALAEACEKLGMPYKLVHNRLQKGWSVKAALFSRVAKGKHRGLLPREV